jgi:hypothetical protein
VVTVSGSVDWGVEVWVDGQAVVVRDFIFSTTVTLGEGAHVIEMLARDLAGNTALVTRSVTVDTRAPAITLGFPYEEVTRVSQKRLVVSGQTEPFATVVVNGETAFQVGRDGLFSTTVVLEDGENRITVKATDAAGNAATVSRTVIRSAPAGQVAAGKGDTSWVNLTAGVLVGIGLAFPVLTYLLAASQGRRRQRVLEVYRAAEQERRERAALLARKLPPPPPASAEPPKEPEPKPPELPPQAPPEMPRAEAAPIEGPPKPEEPAPGPKLGLKDKSRDTEVSPDETDQATRMGGHRPAPAAEPAPGTKPEEIGRAHV